jgi:hypothetical protein
MEPLWSPVVANAGNRSQIQTGQKRAKQAKSVAVGCARLPGAHGKEGVDGSNPSEGFGLFAAQRSLLSSTSTATFGFDVHAASTSVHGSDSGTSRTDAEGLDCVFAAAGARSRRRSFLPPFDTVDEKLGSGSQHFLGVSVLVVPAPPLVGLRLRVALRRVLPLLLPTERR